MAVIYLRSGLESESVVCILIPLPKAIWHLLKWSHIYETVLFLVFNFFIYNAEVVLPGTCEIKLNNFKINDIYKTTFSLHISTKSCYAHLDVKLNR